MFGFAYGHKENGAVFSHMDIMYANALYQRGFAFEGLKLLILFIITVITLMLAEYTLVHLSI